MRNINTIAELDAILREIDQAPTDDERRILFQSFSMDRPNHFPDDPFSPEYTDWQMSLYRSVAGRAYALSNEATPLDVESSLRCPFPYHTGSTATTGHQFTAIGFLLRIMSLPAGSRVLEFGPGWGNTTLALARMGHHVTAVDVEPRFAELVRRRGEQEGGVSINSIAADFLWAERCEEQFDAIVFFECFHHAQDHLRLLRALHRLLKPGGRLFLGAEPIHSQFPLPWGLRLDGQSLWAIRQFGWLELGFRDDYFSEALRRTGWFGRRHVSRDVPDLNVWEIVPATEPIFSAPAADPRIGSLTGQRRDGTIVLQNVPAGAAVYGPYIDLPAGTYRAQIVLGPHERRGRACMDVAGGPGHEGFVARNVDLSALPLGRTQLDLPFTLAVAVEMIEVRLHAESGSSAVVEHISIVQVEPSE